MSLTKMGYDALCEEFCYWYSLINGKYPHNKTVYSRNQMIRFIWSFKRNHAKLLRERKGNVSIYSS